MLFLMEQLIVILVFAICAAVCMRLFVTSYIMVDETSDLNSALLAVESAAETYKATGGDIERMTQILRDTLPGFETDYFLSVTTDVSSETPSVKAAVLTVSKPTGEEIISVIVAARVAENGGGNG
jgi:Tfp pilus assembly protein PilE